MTVMFVRQVNTDDVNYNNILRSNSYVKKNIG